VHVLVVPRKHIPSVADAGNEDEELLGHMMLTVGKVARDLGISERGFRVVANCRRQGGQTVSHLHLHVLGGRQMTWPPG